MNHTGYAERLSFLDNLLKNSFHLEIQTIETIAYDEACRFPYNNFIYHIKIASFAGEWCAEPQPGTVPLPQGAISLVARLTNAKAGGLAKANRVENEVAAMTLARRALQHFPDQLVPAIYAWSSAKKGQGWMLMEHRPGIEADSVFPDLPVEEKKQVLSQLADVVSALQRFEVPDTVLRPGGLSFDKAANMVTGPKTALRGPFEDDWQGLYQAMPKEHIEEANMTIGMDGSGSKGARQWVKYFLTGSRETSPLLPGLGRRRVLVHGDFTTNNVLIDRHSLRLTAVLDFDFAHIGTIADESVSAETNAAPKKSNRVDKSTKGKRRGRETKR